MFAFYSNICKVRKEIETFVAPPPVQHKEKKNEEIKTKI